MRDPGEFEETLYTGDTEAVYRTLLEEKHEHQRLLLKFWDIWSKEYLPPIAARSKWKKPAEKLQRGDLVFVCDTTGWRRGRIIDTLLDPETDQVREALVQTSRGVYRRPATRIAKINVDQPAEEGTTADTNGPPESEGVNASRPVTRSQTVKKLPQQPTNSI